ncbi:MAG: hypothetical protein WHT07_09040 [Desulfobaccales bacterium]
MNSNSLFFYAGVFLITACTLMFQLAETRILSVILWYHLAFFAISMAMFGLTLGAVWVYYCQERYAARLSYYLAYFSTAFGVSMVFSLVGQLLLPVTVSLSLTALLAWLLLAVFLALPYIFSGITVSLALTQSPFPVSRVYGVDMVGAAVGCLAVLGLLSLTDGPSAVLWLGVLAIAAGGLFARSGLGGSPEAPPPAAAWLAHRLRLALPLAAFALLNGLTVYGLQPLVVKDDLERRNPFKLVAEKWNYFSRVTVHRMDSEEPMLWGPSSRLPANLKVEHRILRSDGFSDAQMFPFRGRVEEVEFLKYDVVNLAYFLPERPRVAVVGAGGGRDVLSAWVFGRRDITGLELNPILVDLVTRHPEISRFAGLAHLPGVRLLAAEARNWFTRNPETFDIIQMSLAGDERANAAGGFTTSENGLYTVEAWRTFLSRLTPKGVFSVSRWYSPGEVDEFSRLLSLAVATLLEQGVRDPKEYLFAVSSGKMATLLIAASPWIAQDLAALEQAVLEYDYRLLLHPHNPPASPSWQAILGAGSRQALDELSASFLLDVRPPTDDRPFFFNHLPFHRPSAWFPLARQSTPGGALMGNFLAAFTLLLILAISLFLVTLTIIVPLRPAVREVPARLIAGGTAYFLLIGVGFMMVEIGLFQRLGVFLGHPFHGLSLVLFSLIFTTGLGSLLSGALPLIRPGWLFVWALLTAAYLGSLPIWVPGVLAGAESTPLFWRGVLSVAIIAPAGLLMGCGFPTGMRLVMQQDARPTPWFWGINGAAGVLAAGAAAILGLAWGVSLTLTAGALCYAALIPAAAVVGFAGSSGGQTG